MRLLKLLVSIGLLTALAEITGSKVSADILWLGWCLLFTGYIASPFIDITYKGDESDGDIYQD